ncbi:MAG: biopolymer transporter ExbD [Chitinophagaceae bacterium]|nr:MAG: biopolymer transporter ExbD [Chitinophagaceae bacterium]
MNIRRKLKAHSEVHTGPLNDILFILLLFFLIAATLANPNVTKVSLPRGTKDTKAKQNLNVSIDKDQNLFVGTQRVDPALIDSILKQKIEEQRKSVDTPTIVIHADTVSYSGRMIHIMQVISRNKAKSVIAVRP